MNRFIAVSIVAILLVAAGAARADIFILTGDGQVQGEIVASPNTPKDKTVIRTASGGEVTLDKSQIKQIIPQSAADLEYEKIRPTYPDTVEGQWQLAEWCRDHSLTKQRQTHLERVIALDPEHKQARALLGYAQVDGRWIRRDDLMKERGYVFYNGAWKLPQDVELIERRKKQEQAQREWFAKLRRWRTSVDNHPEREEILRDEIMTTTDAAAVPAIEQMLNNEPNPKIKVLLINALVHLGTGEAIAAVVKRTLDDPDEEVRLSALDKLTEAKRPELVAGYAQVLKSKDNVKVNRAAYCLGQLKDKSAISPLIDALQTWHKYPLPGPPPGQMSTGFGSGPGGTSGGLSVGGSQPKEVKVLQSNQEVLRALIALTGQNFDYNQQTWKTWFAAQRKPVNLDARRGE
jgi:hypothetical protein